MQEKIEDKDLFPEYEFPSYPMEMDYPYIIVAYYIINGHWKVFNGMYKTQEAAKEAAARIGRGWICKRVYCLRGKQ